jgi:tripartite-type tricarboxylate transporter receptor subunit TctC
MRFPRRHFLHLAVGAAALALQGGIASGERFPVPGKTVRIIVPFAPGGQTDVQARAIAQKLTISLGVPVIVENKPGASTLIAAREVQHAEPDGHTLLYTIAIHVQLPYLYKTAPYDALRDFTPITTGVRSSFVLTAHVDSVQHRARACGLCQGEPRQAELHQIDYRPQDDKGREPQAD